MATKKGIYCIEGFWEQNNVQNESSVFPLLDLLNRNAAIPFIHHRCATKDEVMFMLERWIKQSAMRAKYPILYFATHGGKGVLDFGNKIIIDLKELGEKLRGSSANNVFIFGSCSTMKMDLESINGLLQQTGALAALGYKKKVDWMVSAAAELLLLNYLQEDVTTLDTVGIKRELEKAMREQKTLFESLGFTIVINPKPVRRPRKALPK